MDDTSPFELWEDDTLTYPFEGIVGVCFPDTARQTRVHKRTPRWMGPQ